MKQKKRGISLIVLVITVIVIVILAMSVILTLSKNNHINNAKEAVELSNKQTATEKMNLKLTTIQMDSYTKVKRLPTLQELANILYSDPEIASVSTQSSFKKNEETEVASLTADINIEGSTSIYTKLNEFPYEFEIDSSLRLASIDGIKIANSNSNGENEILVDKEEYENLKNTVNELKNNRVVLYLNKEYTTGVSKSEILQYATSSGLNYELSDIPGNYKKLEIVVGGVHYANNNYYYSTLNNHIWENQVCDLYVFSGSGTSTASNYLGYQINATKNSNILTMYTWSATGNEKGTFLISVVGYKN